MTKQQTGKIVVAVGITIVLGILAVVGFSYFMQSSNDADRTVTIDTGELHPVTIHCPSRQPMVATGETTHNGTPVMVRCNTCHDNKEANTRIGNAGELDQFHQNLKFQHGSLKCASCHDPENYESLRLADGSSVSFDKVVTLCAQCHGPQYRDYKNGSHGGMKGYWDLTRGPRTRNGCTDCHDAHAPAYPQVMPVFPPKRRVGTEGDHSH